MWRSWRNLILALLCGLSATSIAYAARRDTGGTTAALDWQEGPVLQLIERLGAASYAVREEAAARLSRLGMAAFDELAVQALTHGSAEVRLRAQYLMRSIPFRWSQAKDPDLVREALRDYQRQSLAERRARARRLSRLEDAAGIEALCRVARFEHSELLSRQAALDVMRYPTFGEADLEQQVAGAIQRAAGRSGRAAVAWLEAYAECLDDPRHELDSWKPLLRSAAADWQTDAAVKAPIWYRQLLRWYAARCVRQSGAAREAEVVEQYRILERDAWPDNPDPETFAELAAWLVDLEAWPQLESMWHDAPAAVRDDPLFLYCRAEAAQRQGDAAESTRLQELARKQGGEEAASHCASAVFLEGRGRIDWAVAEYRQVFAMTELGSYEDLWARARLAELLHDQGEDRQAAETLQELVDAMESDAAVANRLERMGREPGSTRSRAHFFHAEYHRAQRNREQQMEHLRQAIAADPRDADVLIAMFQLPRAEPEWRRRTGERIRQAVASFEEELRESSARGDVEDRLRLASTYNQLAWLVSNTEGNFDEALRNSWKSLELKPRTAGYLDTLARCYFALGDVPNAVKYQRRAASLEPYSGQIGRQLQEFEAALSDPPATRRPARRTSPDPSSTPSEFR
jgi:tetratricopeptide (TPR) repeat protein